MLELMVVLRTPQICVFKGWGCNRLRFDGCGIEMRGQIERNRRSPTMPNALARRQAASSRSVPCVVANR